MDNSGNIYPIPGRGLDVRAEAAQRILEEDAVRCNAHMKDPIAQQEAWEVQLKQLEARAKKRAHRGQGVGNE